MTETAFARASFLILLKAISQHELRHLGEGRQTGNRSLLRAGISARDRRGDPGRFRFLPERGLLQFSQADEAAYNEERPLPPAKTHQLCPRR